MTGPFRTSVGHAFGRTAMPLAAYYGVTLALPLANGAGRSGTAFVQHAVIVLAVPPMLVLLICAIHAIAEGATRYVWSSALREAPLRGRARSVQRLNAEARHEG